MKKNAWKNKIKKACAEAGTYREYFDQTITCLAEVLEKRDSIEQEIKDCPDGATVEYTNKNGSTNTAKNPLWLMWADFTNTALAYWRDLGLTPAGMKKLDERCFEKKKESNSLMELINRSEERDRVKKDG